MKLIIDRARKVAHRDGWMILGADGDPISGVVHHTREDARRVASKTRRDQVVRCRMILAWRSP